MKRLIAILALNILFIQSAYAGTFYYEPTPYPLYKQDGNPMPQTINIVHLWDGWINNVFYGMKLIRDDRLQVGGWGDEYRTYIKFDVAGLPYNPTQAILLMKTYDRGDGSNATPFKFCKVGNSWTTSMTWDNQPSLLNCAGWFTPPAPGNSWGIIFTPWYNEWKNANDAIENNGVMMAPRYSDNTFTVFRSSRFTAGVRPTLQFEFTPTMELKMPLPGDHQWLVTNEVGGYECKGEGPFWPDKYHMDDTGNFFSIDFSWKNIPNPGATTYNETSNIPVLAAAGGTVSVVGTVEDHPNGYYVVIDHGGGYSTRYLHLKTNPSAYVYRWKSVVQGEQIGVMGTTGKDQDGNRTSTGVHLHFGVRYNDSGLSTIPELTKVVMDGRLLKSYQTECSTSPSGIPQNWVKYYRSFNAAF